MATLNEHIPQGTGSGSGPRCQDTILGDIPAQTRFERLSKQSNDPPISRVNTLGSGEDSMKLNELMEIYTKLSERVLALENIKTAQDLEITNLKKRFQEDAETQGRYGHDTEINIASTLITTASINITTTELVIISSALVATASVSVSTAKPSTPPTTTTTFIKDEDLTIAQTLMKMRSVKSKEKSKEKRVSSETATRLTREVIMKEASKTATRPIVPPQQRLIIPPQQHLDPKDKGKGIMQEPEKPVKGKDQIEYDADMAKRLQAELDKEVRIEREREEEATRKKFFAAKRAEEQRNKPPTKAEQRKKLCTYMKHMAGYKDKDFKGKSFDAIKQMFDKAYKQVNDFVPMDTESSRKKAVSKKRAGERPSKESAKRQKIEDDAEKAELKACLEIVPGDDSVVNIESLAIKYPIVDWKTHILAKDKMYYQIISADGSTQYYKIFSVMLNDFDRQDVLDLYRLVKERFESTCLERYDRYFGEISLLVLATSKIEDIWYAGSDTRPPMLDRTDFESWQQRIRLYCLGKDNGENIMKSITEGPFQMGTFIQTPAEDAEETEGALQLGPERARVFTDLSAEEKERYKADIRATNILLQGIPKDIYTLINHYTDAKDIWDNVKMILEGSELTKDDRESQLYDEFERFCQIKGETIHVYYVRFSKLINDMRNIKMTMSRMQLNSKFVNNMLPEWSRFITEVKLNRGLKESNFDQCLLEAT
ncbi:hypothetical protein Tco_1331448 [Tanacetum coccineum]